MPKFIRKPVIVEANQYFGVESNDLLGVCCDAKCGIIEPHVQAFPHVHATQGFTLRIEKGDWILPEPDGEHFYPVKDKLFRDAYEPLCESATAQT